MPWYKDIPLDLVWPVGLILAWWAGEWLYAWLRIPKISVYAGVGFLLGGGQAGWLPAIPGQGIELAAHAALGLILFEFGHRISLGWLRRNPWLLVIAAVEQVRRICDEGNDARLLRAELETQGSVEAMVDLAVERFRQPL